jgi:hypothetical protein
VYYQISIVSIHSVSLSDSTSVMVSTSILILLCLFVASGGNAKPLVSEETLSRGHSGQGPLPLAVASPLNVEEDMDCVVKTLAWEFAKKHLPRVSIFSPNFCVFDTYM